MAEQEEYAEIVVGGARYRDWKSVSVTRSGQSPESAFVFEAASPAESGQTFGGKRIRVGDPCQVFLGGVKVVDGEVTARQPAFTEMQHGLQIIGRSKNIAVDRQTVEQKPGEFKGYGIKALASALAKPAGVEVVLRGSPDGADKPFPMFRVQLGETIFSAISRLARMRNLFVTDDDDGRLVLFRNDGSEGQVAELAEGRNIKSASGVFTNEFPFQKIEVQGSRPSGDQAFGTDAVHVSGEAKNDAVKKGATLTVVAEMPGDKKDMEMRAQHELAENLATMVTVQAVVQGWHMDSGSLWIQKIGQNVAVYSPMLFTDDRMTLTIDTVVHRQDARGGTDTVINLVLPGRYGGANRVDITGA